MQVEYKPRMMEEEEEVEKKMEGRIAFLLVATVSSLSSYIYNTISSFSMYLFFFFFFVFFPSYLFSLASLPP